MLPSRPSGLFPSGVALGLPLLQFRTHTPTTLKKTGGMAREGPPWGARPRYLSGLLTGSVDGTFPAPCSSGRTEGCLSGVRLWSISLWPGLWEGLTAGRGHCVGCALTNALTWPATALGAPFVSNIVALSPFVEDSGGGGPCFFTTLPALSGILEETPSEGDTRFLVLTPF